MINDILHEISSIVSHSTILRATPIGNIHLSRKTHLLLEHRGIQTLKDLIPLLDNDPMMIMDDLKQALFALSQSIDDGIIDWAFYWQKRGIHVIPQPDSILENLAVQFEALPTLIHEVLLIEGKNGDSGERAWFIIRHRFGLQGVEKYTLEELGEAFKLSRERVRQIEHKALTQIREVFVINFYGGKKYRVMHNVLNMVRQMRQEVFDSLVTETMLQERAERIWHLDKYRASIWRPILHLFGEIAGYKCLTFADSDLSPIWLSLDEWNVPLVEEWVVRIHRYLTQVMACSVDEFNVFTEVNRAVLEKYKLTVSRFRQLLPNITTIERDETGKVWGAFACLEGRGNQVEDNVPGRV